MANVRAADGTIRPNPDLWAYYQTAKQDSESMAIYADANYTFNESWKLTAGLRYSYDEKKGEESLFMATDPTSESEGSPEGDCCGGLIFDPDENRRKPDDDWDNVSGRAVLDYTINDRQMLYASLTSGYKAGGLRLGGIDPNPSVDEETVWSYEVGYKGSFNDVLQINAAAFFYDYKDLQVMVSRLVEGSANVTLPQMTSVDEAEVKGIEVETLWLPTDSLSLMANYSYVDGEYTDFCCYPNDKGDRTLQDLSGNPMIQTPENKIFMSASYSLQTGSWGEFVPTVSYS